MRRQCVERLLLATLVAGLSCGLSSCNMREEPAAFSASGSYSIDSSTILQSMDRGDADIFMPQESTPPIASQSSPPVQWDQGDYQRIAEAFQELLWNGLEGWELNKVVFRLDCADAPLGPQQASFHWFRTTQTGRTESRSERNIHIRPLQNRVVWGEEVYRPARLRYESLDLERAEISAEEALSIAEDCGGQEIRLNLDNSCDILVFLGADSRYEGWLVSYRGTDPTVVLKVVIDEQTGECEVDTSKVE